MTKLTVAVVLALGAAAVLAAPAAAKPASSQGAGISSIAPATADRGPTSPLELSSIRPADADRGELVAQPLYQLRKGARAQVGRAREVTSNRQVMTAGELEGEGRL